MSQPDLFVGIDVAKDELVIRLHPAGMLWRVVNSKTGLAMLGRKLTRLAGTACLRISRQPLGAIPIHPDSLPLRTNHEQSSSQLWNSGSFTPAVMSRLITSPATTASRNAEPRG